MGSLDETILAECGKEKGMNIYNFICEEFRRMDGYFGGTRIMRGDEMYYKGLFYECFKCVDKYLSLKCQNQGFSWKNYGTALKLIQNEHFGVMKLKLKDEAAFLVNKTINDYYSRNGEGIESNSQAYNFSVVAFNVLKGFNSCDLEPLIEYIQEYII